MIGIDPCNYRPPINHNADEPTICDMKTARINVRRLTTLIFLSLLAPMAVAIVLDMGLGWMPIFTIGAAVIFIPLSSVIVVRATLAELEMVIQAVAPLEPDPQELRSAEPS
jgi:hypothetical protein